MATATSEVHRINHEELAEDAARLNDVIRGVLAVLHGNPYPQDVERARDLLAFAGGLCGDIEMVLDARREEARSDERADRAHREQQAKVTAANVQVSR